MTKTPPAHITSYTMDNRGEAQFAWSTGLDTQTLTRFVAAIYTAGNDGNLGTSDDVRLRSSVSYKKGILTINAPVALNQRYRVKIEAAFVKDAFGRFIDGEFNGDGVAGGNGVQGGNVDIMTAPASKTRVRYTTPQGPIVVGLFKNTPNTKANFVGYANQALWDSTVMHRSQTKNPDNIDIVQGGGFRLNSKANTTTAIDGDILTHPIPPVANEAANLNAAGTLAMANAGPGTGTIEWFFNVTANTGLDTQTNPGVGDYTVFGAVEKSGLRSMQALLSAYPNSQGVPLPLGNAVPNHTQQRDHVPIVDIPALNARGGVPGFSPKLDLVVFSRVAILSDVVATSVVPASAHAAATVNPSTFAQAAVPTTDFATKKAIEVDDGIFA
jgi:cyclophilin family peptidyl-prolyl cis-trans isomerase